VATPSSTAELAEMLGRELAAAGSRFSWQLQGLREGVAAYCFGRLAEKLARPVLIVAPTASVAEGFALDLRTVLGEREDADFLTRRVHLFPERDAPPFEMVSPSL
jgi:chorismate synthase